jgi:hypothetical protein
MNRTEYRDRHRKRLGIAIMVSIAAHAVLLAFLKVDVDVPAEPERQRATRLIELADAWQDRPLEVVLLRDASSGTAASSDATAALPDTEQAAEAGAMPPASEGRPVLAGTAPNLAELDLALAEEVSIASVTFKNAQRGVVLRAGGPVGPSDAAADDERWWDGGGRGGIGIRIAGGDCGAPGTFGIPVIGGRGGGIGSLPLTGKGRGLLGGTGDFGSAINRVGPSRS